MDIACEDTGAVPAFLNRISESVDQPQRAFRFNRPMPSAVSLLSRSGCANANDASCSISAIAPPVSTQSPAAVSSALRS